MSGNHNTASHPNWLAMTSFFLRSRGLQVQRSAKDVLSHLPTLGEGRVQDFPHVLAESVSPLHTAADPRERPLILGKIQNLRLACRRIHHRVLPAGEVFSLWRQIGPPWRSRGFVRGREVREGCVVPTSGGGLCQLSGSLFEVALTLDLELLEHHSHTLEPADIPRNPRRDATLFWNYVDLRFRSRMPLLLECFLTESSLVVRLRGGQARESSVQIKIDPKRGLQQQSRLESCFTCDQSECRRHVNVKPVAGKTAFLMDEYQPEFAQFLRQHSKDGDQVLLPFISRQGWGRSLAAERLHLDVLIPSWFRLHHSMTLRWAAYRRMTVAKAHFGLAEILARFCERRLAFNAEHVCVAQNLLPYLWRSGLLGGRTFDVLVQRLPVVILERQLDAAVQRYPQSKTLAEFRAPRWFADAEEEALRAARAIFTPHPQLAALFHHAACLGWEVPPRKNGYHTNNANKDLLVFMGPTVARKGAYAVREAIRKTGFRLAVAGAELETANFWSGLPVDRVRPQELPWERVHTVVQPALFEYWPRQLLRAHAAGANLVITPMCGLEEDHASGIHHVPFGDADALASTLTTLLTTQGDPHCEA